MKDKALEIVCDNNDIEVPETMINDEIDQMIRELDMQLQQQGIAFQQYLQFIGKEIADFREEVKEDAAKRVKMRMVIRAVVDAENIEATEEEIEKEIELLAIQYGIEAQQVKDMLGEDNLQFIGKDVKVKKAVDFIFDNAVIK